MQEYTDFANYLVPKVPPASLLAFDPVVHVSSNADEYMQEVQEQPTLDIDIFISALEDELEFNQKPFELREYSRAQQVTVATQNTCDTKDTIDLFITEEEAAAIVATKTPKRSKKIVKQNKTKAKTDAERKEKNAKKKNKRLCDTTHFQKLNDCNIHKKMLKAATSEDWKNIKENDPVTRAYYKQIANDFNTFALKAYKQDKYDESTKYMLNSKWRENIKNAFWAVYN